MRALRRWARRLLTCHRRQEWLLDAGEVDLRNGGNALTGPTSAQGAIDLLQHLPVVTGQEFRQLADCPVSLRATVAAAFPGIVRQCSEQSRRALSHAPEL